MKKLIAAAATAAVCAAAHADTTHLAAVLDAQPSGSVAKQLSSISYVRQQELRKTADVLGAQTGFADRSARIAALVRRDATRLDAAFPFNALMIGVGVMPPVIVETRGVVSLTNPEQVMRVADRTYEIVQPPRFVAIAPTWRNYLDIGLSSVQPVIPSDSAELPQNSAERTFWKAEVRKAYANGVAQANAVFAKDLARLRRDYSGMRLFYALYARGMVSAPVIASTHDVQRPDGANGISLGDSTYRITARPSFTKSSTWTPIAPLDTPANGE